MAKITLILGGARCGKSSYAQQLAKDSGKSVTFVATAEALDDEMAERIQEHKSERPVAWQTLEAPLDIASHAKGIQSEVVILDCITLLVSNLMMQFVEDDIVKDMHFMQATQKEIEELLSAIRKSSQHWIIISNEVGLGLVPPYQMGRVYRDGLGWANQSLARMADSVLFLVAGIPMKIKG
jgi:adenosylcobinamide kinase / adenosylcobinamide-phosphate guanylyltransferase